MVREQPGKAVRRKTAKDRKKKRPSIVKLLAISYTQDNNHALQDNDYALQDNNYALHRRFHNYHSRKTYSSRICKAPNRSKTK